MALQTMEFIRRFCLHILPLRFVRIRHFGILNARSKYKIPDLLQAIMQSGIQQPAPCPIMPFLSPKTKTADLCPVCKKGKMVILAFGSGRDPPPDMDALVRLQAAIKISVS